MGRHFHSPPSSCKGQWRITCIDKAEITVGNNVQRTGRAQKRKVEMNEISHKKMQQPKGAL